MILSNVNIGTGPSSGDGDPLRNAFATINTNFQQITNNVNALTNSVTTVAGRTGNVVLTINDIMGLNPLTTIGNLTVTGNLTVQGGTLTLPPNSTITTPPNTNLPGGSINITAGPTEGSTGGDVRITGGSGFATISPPAVGHGGNVYIEGGYAGAGGAGYIRLTSNSNNWTFDADGDLTFPDTTVQTTAYTATYANASPTPTSLGTTGDIVQDGVYIYHCISANTWVRGNIVTSW